MLNYIRVLAMLEARARAVRAAGITINTHRAINNRSRRFFNESSAKKYNPRLYNNNRIIPSARVYTRIESFLRIQ